MKFLLIAILALVTSDSIAQSRLPVFVTPTGDDAVGILLAHELREGLRASHGLELVDTKKESLIRLKLTSIDPEDGPELRTAYAFVITVRIPNNELDMYWGDFVGTCKRSNVSQCAASLIAETDNVAVKIREIVTKHAMD